MSQKKASASAKVLSSYEFMSKFASKRRAVNFYEKSRWPDGVVSALPIKENF